ncbi:MAG TPA: S1/P1 nuclease [Thermoanaerobaculia bacterium]|nr:S1/P1 nuclease [Thermoanaerobaculia bacterium]
MIRVFMVLALVCPALSAFAWGNPGHEIIARVAQARLSANVRSEVLELLRNRDCRPIRRSMAEVSTLPDRFRNQEGGQIGRSWHFVNIDIAHTDYAQERDCPLGDCVIRRVDRAAEMLRNDEDQFSDCERKDALIYIIHFVGDLHQPFHCGFGRFQNGDRDRGGNSVQVTIGGERTNLHSAWDGLLLDDRTQDEWIAHLQDEVIPALDQDLANETSVAAWADESHDVARTEHPRPPRRNVVSELDANYVEKNRPVVEQRLALAAVRLAKLITRSLQ